MMIIAYLEILITKHDIDHFTYQYVIIEYFYSIKILFIINFIFAFDIMNIILLFVFFLLEFILIASLI
jgi:hypothetical protein